MCHHILRVADSSTRHVAVVKGKGVHRHPPRVHRLSTVATQCVDRPVAGSSRGSVLFSCTEIGLVTLTARAVFGKGRRCMRMVRAGVVALLCLLLAAPATLAQLPPQTPTPVPAPVTPPATPTPTTPQTPATTPAPGGTMT